MAATQLLTYHPCLEPTATGEEQYSGTPSWKRWIGFGHVGLVEEGESYLPSRGTIVGNSGSKKAQGVFGDLTNSSQLLLS